MKSGERGKFVDARVTLGLTQKQMAVILNTKLSTLQKWESGVNQVPGSAEAVITLCNKYKGAVQYLLGKYT